MKSTIRGLALACAALAFVSAVKADGYGKCMHCYPCQIPPYNAFGCAMPIYGNGFSGNGQTFNAGPAEPWQGFRPVIQQNQGGYGCVNPFMRSPRDFFMYGN